MSLRSLSNTNIRKKAVAILRCVFNVFVLLPWFPRFGTEGVAACISTRNLNFNPWNLICRVLSGFVYFFQWIIKLIATHLHSTNKNFKICSNLSQFSFLTFFKMSHSDTYRDSESVTFFPPTSVIAMRLCEEAILDSGVPIAATTKIK